MPGLLKAMLVLRHRHIPATLHTERPNPDIDFDGLGVRPSVTPEPLAECGTPIVGVNSFGFGGSNAHVVLAAAPNPTGPTMLAPTAPEVPVIVSGRTEAALAEAATRLADHLELLDDKEFLDLSYTSCRRLARRERSLGVVAGNAKAVAEALREAVNGTSGIAGVTARTGRIGFVFSGHGAQWAGMGVALLAEPIFEQALDNADAALRPHTGWSVKEMLARAPADIPIEDTEIVQPMLFALQVSLVALLRHWGVHPHAVTGHSLGEIAAAHTAGALTLDEAARLVAARCAAQALTAGRGRMAAVGLSECDALVDLQALPGMYVAGINSPTDVTVAGDESQLTAWLADLTDRGVFNRMLGLDYAFHCAVMDPVEEPLRNLSI